MSPAGASRAGGSEDRGRDDATTGTRTALTDRVDARPAKTSAAAAVALALGVAAIVCVLTVVLSPVGLVLGVLGLILGIIGVRAARKIGVTGSGVAKTGLVLSVLSVIAAIAFAVGAVTFLNNQGAVDRLDQQVQNLRDKLPTSLPTPAP